VRKPVSSKSPDLFDALGATAVQSSATVSARVEAAKAKRKPAAAGTVAPVVLPPSPFGGADERFLTDKEVAARYGVSRAAVWRWVGAYPNFPKAIPVTPGTSRWRLSELLAYEAAVAAGKARFGRRAGATGTFARKRTLSIPLTRCKASTRCAATR
jgi:prophage regulatory protein